MRLQNPFTKSKKTKPKRKNRSFIATTAGDVFPYAMLELAAIQKSEVNGFHASETNETDIEKASDQRGEQGKATEGQKLASKPFDPALFLWMYNNSVYVRRSVDQIASDIAGTGWKIKLVDDMPEDNAGLDKIMALLERPNWEYSIEDLWQRFLIDRNLIGYDGIEIVRDLDNEVKELWHMSAARLWVHKDKSTGLLAEKGTWGEQSIKWFVRFGMEDEEGRPLQVDKNTGKAGQIEFKDRAHEVIYSLVYYPQSSYYGAPPIVPASGDVVMGVSARDYNLAFFVNYGVPSLLITLSGEWEDDTEPDEESLAEILKRQLQDIKGAKNNHGSVVLQTPENCTMDVTPLALETKEGSFRLIKADVAEDALVAYGMPPYRIGLAKTGSLAGNVADEMLRTYITAVVEPGQLMLERLMRGLFVEGLGVDSYELKLRDIDLWDEKAQAEIDQLRLDNGQATPNMLFRERGMEHLVYVGGDTFTRKMGLLDIGEDETA